MNCPKVLPSGKVIDFFAFTESDINAWDIAWQLYQMNRYNGATPRPFDVATHTLLCFKLAEFERPTLDRENRLAILLHDAAEAYWCDFPRWLKQLPESKFLRDLDDAITKKVHSRFKLDAASLTIDWDFVKWIDTEAAGLEKKFYWPDETFETEPLTTKFPCPDLNALHRAITPKAFVEALKMYVTDDIKNDQLLFGTPANLEKLMNGMTIGEHAGTAVVAFEDVEPVYVGSGALD